MSRRGELGDGVDTPSQNAAGFPRLSLCNVIQLTVRRQQNGDLCLVLTVVPFQSLLVQSQVPAREERGKNGKKYEDVFTGFNFT